MKVNILSEDHKILKKVSGFFFQIFVTFSKYLNFINDTDKTVKAVQDKNSSAYF
jgi:hypothetical protein